MRNLVFIFLLLGITWSAAGQTHINVYDSLLSQLLTRYIEYPDYEPNGKTGINLLHVAHKNGIISLASTYCSDKKFRIKHIDSIQAKLRNRLSAVSPENFDIVFQIVFSFDKQKEIPVDEKFRIIKEIARLKSKKYHISKSPVWLVIYAPLQ